MTSMEVMSSHIEHAREGRTESHRVRCHKQQKDGDSTSNPAGTQAGDQEQEGVPGAILQDISGIDSKGTFIWFGN